MWQSERTSTQLLQEIPRTLSQHPRFHPFIFPSLQIVEPSLLSYPNFRSFPIGTPNYSSQCNGIGFLA